MYERIFRQACSLIMRCGSTNEASTGGIHVMEYRNDARKLAVWYAFKQNDSGSVKQIVIQIHNEDGRVFLTERYSIDGKEIFETKEFFDGPWIETLEELVSLASEGKPLPSSTPVNSFKKYASGLFGTAGKNIEVVESFEEATTSESLLN